MLPLRLLWRHLRSGELRLLSLALVLAVTVVTTISLFTNRVERTMERQGNTFLGADQVVESSQPFGAEWLDAAATVPSVKTARIAEFASMVFAGDQMHLAAVKAVSDGYPILGHLTVTDQPFATQAELLEQTNEIPPPGEVWVEARLLPMLGVTLGDTLDVGELPLTITRILVDEPDRGSDFSRFGARVMINYQDLAATEVVQPGSRIQYRFLLGGTPAALSDVASALAPLYSEHERDMSLEQAQRRLSRSMTTATDYLMLAAMIGILLAGVAIAIAARHFAARQVDQVALLKALGASRQKVISLYGAQLILLAGVTALIGMAVGSILQLGVIHALRSLLPLDLMAASWQAYLPGAVTGVVCLLCFVAPPLWSLPGTPPIKVLRREMSVTTVAWFTQIAMGFLALALLVAFLNPDIWLNVSVFLALILLLGAVAVVAFLLLTRRSRSADVSRGSLRLAIAALRRHQQQSVIQLVVVALAVTLLLTLTNLRTGLLSDWQQQLPEGAPNHFLLNVTPAQVEPVDQLLRDNNLEPQPFYPMVRGRLTAINDELVKRRGEREPAESTDGENRERRGIGREVNLSWASELADDNRIVDGQWWDDWQGTGIGVSVEDGIAERLGVVLGDRLTFSIGGLPLEAEVASIRTLRWDSMNPNFFFLLSPGALESFAPTFLTSVHLEPSDKPLLNTLLQQYPTLVVIEMDRVIAQIQTIVNQVSAGVEWILWLVMVGGVLVIWAAIHASMEARLQEAALLRALGASRKRLLGALWAEFLLLGATAGVLAVVSSEALLSGIQTWVFEQEYSLNLRFWIPAIIASGLVVAGFGVYACRKVVATPPMWILRELG